MIKAHQIRLYPTKSQDIFFRKSCGTARFTYNWALSEWNKKHELGEKASAYSLIKEFTSIKKEKYSWVLEVGKTCPQYAIHNLESAFKNFFKKNTKYPKFHKKGINDSFVAVENKEKFKQENFKLWIPRLGWVKCAENLRYEGKVNNVTIKRIANYWFATINIEVNIPNKTQVINENQVVIGVDLGIKNLATVSNGLVFENPKALNKRLKSLRVSQKSLCRKVKGSNNRKKQQMKVSKLYYKISCIRKDALHKATTTIVNSADVIVLENLNVKGMVKNRSLSQAIGDASFGEFRRQIEYKAKWNNKQVVIADTFFPSSKTCSCCGWIKKDLKLKDRTFVCESCGLEIDRDFNASKNLANYGSTERFSGSEVLGVESFNIRNNVQLDCEGQNRILINNLI